MPAAIEIMGHTVSFDGFRWRSDNADAAELCRLRAKNFEGEYFPDRIAGIAVAVAESLNGRVIHLDPIPPNNDPPDTIY